MSDDWADYDMPGQGPGFETWVQETYRDVVGELYDPDAEPRGVNKEAVDEVVRRTLAAIETGELTVPAEAAVREAARRARMHDSNLAEKVMHAMRAGQDALPLADDPAFRTMVSLGDGWTKQWRHVTQDDLDAMDTIRYRNMRRAANAYDRWRVGYERLRPVLMRHKTIEEALRASDLPESDGSGDI